MTTAIPWDIDNLTIRHGKHDPPNGQVSSCAMEAAYLRWAARQGWPKKKIVDGWTDSRVGLRVRPGLLHPILCGLHSRIPICCIAFFVMT